jgi:hypothetical protein
MGGAVGAIAGGFAVDRAIGKGVGKAQQGYANAMGSYRAGEEKGLGFLQPYTDVGQGALSPLSALLTGRSYDQESGEFTDLSPEDRFSSFTESPGYQFRFDEGLRAARYGQNAEGYLDSGRGLKELTQYGQGVASQDYQGYINNLMGLSNIGQASAGQSANIATGTAGDIGAAQIGHGNISMQGRIARGQNQASTFGQVGGSADKYAGMPGSDIKLKENIKEVGKSESGIPIYHFEYKDKTHGEGRFEGVMAQDLLKSNPDAVIQKVDHLAVDYDKIDVNFKRI